MKADQTAHLKSGFHTRVAPGSRKWKPGALTITIVFLIVCAMGVGLYPSISQWLNSYNQSQIIAQYNSKLDSVEPDSSRQIELAHEYNLALSSGVNLLANANVPEGVGSLSSDVTPYDHLLRGNEEGLMGRVKISAIDVDLPIYHGTSEATLLKGAGHLEGSHLPVGGDSTHSVITAHRGLANSTMFTNLNQIADGDTFTLEILGEVLTYQVTSTKVVDPADTDTIRPVIGKDLVTLVTCTPLGINTHRILVTGERITPTPVRDIATAGQTPGVPGFPWWSVWALLGLLGASGYLIYGGYVDARVKKKKNTDRH